MHRETVIPARFNGPPTSGNGGYSCGVLAAFIDGAARVRLHEPPPLDTPLSIVATDNDGFEMHAGETLVGSGGPAVLAVDIPDPPSMPEAQRAMSAYPGHKDHAFPTCFVCGPQRTQEDGLNLFPGPVGDSSMLACVWSPCAGIMDNAGNIRPEILWSALDCPGYFAAMGKELRPAVLGELVAQLYATVAGGQPLIVFAWPLGAKGRKFFAGTAIATAAGTVVAASRSTWIQLKT